MKAQRVPSPESDMSSNTVSSWQSRRQFFGQLGIATLLAQGFSVPFATRFPANLIPAALAQDTSEPGIPGKENLRVLNDRPINAETPVTLLDPDITPNALHFVRNNGHVPARAIQGSLDGWNLSVDGEVDHPQQFTLTDLKSTFAPVKARLVLECGGNGRAGFTPSTSGNQWTLGAVGCAEYTGIRLKDLLTQVGLKQTAVFVAYYGEDPHLSLNPDLTPISRGVPLAKALHPSTLLAWEMNGEPLPALHGFPLRLICPGYPASASGKWLTRLWVRDQIHDGPKMTGSSYRVPKYPVAPGSEVPDEDMEIIETMPVKSIITHPATGHITETRHPLKIRGHAWTGTGAVAEMHVSIDFGSTWKRAWLHAPINEFAWQRWQADIKFPEKGYYEVWARATDFTGRMQPMLVPGWNPKGYLNNAMHRIAVHVVA